MIIGTDIEKISKDFESGYIYRVNTFSRTFVIIYLDDDHIYLSNEFRSKLISRGCLMRHLGTYIKEDFEIGVKFNGVSESYYEFNEPPLPNKRIDYYQLEYAKYPITFEPNIQTILSVIKNSVHEYVVDEKIC